MEGKITLLAFGQAARILGARSVEWPLAPDAGTLRRQLNDRFPDLAALPYLLAVDQEIAEEGTPLREGVEVAVMPPYAGG